MAHNKLYRNFIILQEDERGYSHASDKTLSGYAKIEAKGDKCKVSFYAQNLGKEDNYSMVLICCKRDLKQLIDIGPLAVNEVGKGDTSKEYYVNNIAGLGISYEKISGAAICRIKDNENEFIMHGFMNGEESADNWRKFKYIKADAKKYSSKLDGEPLKKDIVSPDIANKTIVSQLGDKSIKTPVLQNELVERKKEEDKLLSKEKIELEKIDSNSKVEEIQNRIPENYTNITETKDNLDEDRKKCKENKKDEKYDKCDKCDKSHEYDHYENNEDVEEIIGKLAKKLEIYDGVLDIEIDHHIYEDVIVYGFIKEKNNHNCNWKKFKLEKKCKGKGQDYNNFQNFKRIEENFKLDKLNESNNSGRMDIIDFDKYENNIKQGNYKSTTGMSTASTGTMGTGMGNMGQTTTGTTGIGMGSTGQTVTGTMGNMGQTSTGTMGSSEQPWAGYGMNQMETGDMNKSESEQSGQLDLSDGEPIGLKKQPIASENQPTISENQPQASNQCKINGNIGQYFEKIAEGFAPYFGSLTDINHCKWYKVDVNSIDDLSNESNYNKYTLAYYPMLNYYPYISKLGHFLLGYKCNRTGDMQYIIYAIPGSKAKNDQPYGGRTGFVTWTSDSKSGTGYWLMFYDFKNSSIVIPTK